MINPNEFRVGNSIYVLHPFSQNWNIEKIKAETIVNLIKNGSNSSYSKNFKCVPISEDLLLQKGFIKHTTNPFWFRKKQLCVSLLGAIELISWDMQVFKVDSKIEYMHEVENFYYSLTSEEL